MARAYIGAAVIRRIAPLLILIALIAAPFGRAQAAPVHAAPTMATTMAGHCDPVAPSAPAPAHHGASIDCTIACAAVPASNAAFAPHAITPIAAVTPLEFVLHGIRPAFDPPPPRLS